MQSRFGALALFLTSGTLVLPALAHAGGIPFFGPIIPAAHATCAAGWGMLVIVVNNIISFALTIGIVFLAPLMLAYAGFLYVINPANPGARSKANQVLTSTIVGMVIALSAWLIVGAVMAVLYNPSNAWGTWTNLLSGNGQICLVNGSAFSSGSSGTNGSGTGNTGHPSLTSSPGGP